MKPYQRDFIELARRCDVLRFGEFTLKSGRQSPYFFNAGAFASGAALAQLGRFYAQSIVDAGVEFDVLLGPAYKGIPLVVTAAAALAADHGRDVGLCFNRKEAKDHGEGGVLVGHALRDGDRVLIVEDVTTAGTSIRETVPILRAAANVEVVGLVVSVDRMERGPSGEGSALEEVGREFGMRTEAIVTLDDIVEHLRPDGGAAHAIGADDLARIRAYRDEYGVAGGVAGGGDGAA